LLKKVWISDKFGFRNKFKLLDLFRKTRATQMYRNGVELALISCLLGHSCIETTKVYATASLEMLRTAMEAAETPEQLKEKALWKECSEEEMAKLCGLR
jgi:hypothetical protein